MSSIGRKDSSRMSLRKRTRLKARTRRDRRVLRTLRRGVRSNHRVLVRRAQ